MLVFLPWLSAADARNGTAIPLKERKVSASDMAPNPTPNPAENIDRKGYIMRAMVLNTTLTAANAGS
jgi:hypothetical protein